MNGGRAEPAVLWFVVYDQDMFFQAGAFDLAIHVAHVVGETCADGNADTAASLPGCVCRHRPHKSSSRQRAWRST